MKTILVLEDDASNMRAFRTTLSSEGYCVLEATTGNEAIEVGDSHAAIDLLVSDVRVPEPSGPAVALRLTNSHPSLGVLFVSGTPMDYWSKDDLDNFKQLPSDLVDFMEKPFRLSAFLNRVDELIKRHDSNE